MDEEDRRREKWEKEGKTRQDTDLLILDGYVDEPSVLGVPPYISPEPRKLCGVAEELGLSWEYLTVDEYRLFGLPSSDMIAVHGGVTVPGTYLGGTPLSVKEAKKIGKENQDRETFLGGPLAKYESIPDYDHHPKKDLDAYLHDHLKRGKTEARWSTLDEMNRWLLKGAKVVERHPLFPDPLLAELSAYRGCPRYFTGGCSFCSEPDYGRPEFREQKDMIQESKELYRLGVRKFRLGGQSCTISYKAEGIGEKERPKPRPGELKRLLRGVKEECPDLDVLHLDNANPAVIATYPERSKRALEIIVEYTTSGNVLALGMESADEEVIERNNLNSRPEEVKKAVEMMNEVGKEKGQNGMPKLLPGINFLAGLKGETEKTYDKNLEFLKDIKEEGLLLRRINIRQVLSSEQNFEVCDRSKFKGFKKEVREEIDQYMLKEMLPRSSVLRDVYMEKRDGKKTFGRQVGTYPLLVGVKYPLSLEEYRDVQITDFGFRSVTAIEYPFYMEEASFSQLKTVPGIGKKRAARIFREQPRSEEEFKALFQDEEKADSILRYISFKGERIKER